MGSSLERNQLPSKISRREFLKGGAAVLVSFALRGCKGETSFLAPTGTLPPKPTERPEPLLTFTPTATDTPLPTSTLTPTPTETPTPFPTPTETPVSAEALEEKWGKIWVLGGGGIDFLLIQWLNLFQFRKVATAIWAIAITILILDFISGKARAELLRNRL